MQSFGSTYIYIEIKQKIKLHIAFYSYITLINLKTTKRNLYFNLKNSLI